MLDYDITEEEWSGIFATFKPNVESEIEKQFAKEWIDRCMSIRWGTAKKFVDKFESLPSSIEFTYLTLAQSNFMFPQFPIGSYKADFLLYRYALDKSKHNLVRLPPIVVECDGHDFHEKTKQQAAHDRRRDRFMSIKGYHVMRFTGSEIYRDVKQCADEVDEMFSSFVK